MPMFILAACGAVGVPGALPAPATLPLCRARAVKPRTSPYVAAPATLPH